MSEVRYLLDTNIVSALARNPQGPITRKIATVGAHRLAISIVTAAELRFGCAKRGSPRLTQQIEAILEGFDVRALEHPVDVHYGDIRARLEAAGTPIGPNDLLIAAHARALGATLVTADIGEFSRVPGLDVENWLANGASL